MPQEIDPDSMPRREMLLKALEEFEPFESLLDIGCGFGEDLKLIEHKFGVTGWGIEPDTDKTEGIEHFKIVNQHATILQNKIFKDNSIDIIISNAAIMYIDWPGGALKEMYRICRKGIVMVEQVSDYMDHALGDYHAEKIKTDFGGGNEWDNRGYLIKIRK